MTDTARRSLIEAGAAGLLSFGLPIRARAERAPPLDVGYVPTPPEVVMAMLRLARVGPDDLVYDLGSGDGRIAIAAAQRFGARATGVELDPARVAQARANAVRQRVADRVSFVAGDLFEQDLAPATVITLYLLPRLNLRLRPTLQALRPGTRIVSHAFDMGDWAPDQTRVVADHPIFLWVVRQGG